MECLPNDQFAQVAAVIEPGAEIRTSKLYFRSDTYPDFCYVEMELLGEPENMFLGTLPLPSAETEHVVYYIEAVDQSFNGARTAEYVPEVATGSECLRQDPALALLPGASPGIIVGVTRAGMAAIPPGFQAAGIAGFISAAGVTSGVSAGMGAGTVTAVGAAGGAAAAAGAAVAASGGETETTRSVSAASSESALTTTTTAPASTTTTSVTAAPVNELPVACYDTVPDPAVIEVGESVPLDASTNFLEVPSSDDEFLGYVLLNGAQTNITPGGVLFRLQIVGRPGENTIVAHTGTDSGQGFWRFDFKGRRISKRASSR
jgi:hypothetical protein